jgi:hypothetical protein
MTMTRLLNPLATFGRGRGDGSTFGSWGTVIYEIIHQLPTMWDETDMAERSTAARVCAINVRRESVNMGRSRRKGKKVETEGKEKKKLLSNINQ